MSPVRGSRLEKKKYEMCMRDRVLYASDEIRR